MMLLQRNGFEGRDGAAKPGWAELLWKNLWKTDGNKTVLAAERSLRISHPKFWQPGEMTGAGTAARISEQGKENDSRNLWNSSELLGLSPPSLCQGLGVN